MPATKVKNYFGISSFTLIVTFVCLALLGVVFIPKLPVKLAPSQEMPGLSINYSVRNASSRVVESEVTSRLEAVLVRVKGVKSISSSSNNGSGSIRLSFDKHTDLAAVRFEVATAVRQVWRELPEEVSFPQISMNRSESESARPFLVYTLNAPDDPAQIQLYGEEKLKPVIAQIEGVDKVELNGAMPMEWVLTYDSEQLERVGLTPEDLREAIQTCSGRDYPGVGRWIYPDGTEQRLAMVVMTDDPQKNFSFENVALKTTNGQMLTLDKLVDVEHKEKTPDSYFRVNGLNSIYLSVIATQNANQLETGALVRNALARMESDMPGGYELHKNYDATEYIQQELDKIYFRTILTVLILLLFVLVITRNWRYLFLIVVSLSITILISFIFYFLFGLEMQLYSMAGITISLNLVIDNSIVMTEHMLRRRNLKAFMAILAATLTTMGALVIIFFMDERVRLNLQDFAAVVIINLAVSLLVALFLVPSLIDKFGMLNRMKRGKKSLVFKRITVHVTHAYRWMVRGLCRYRAAVCIVLVLVFGLPVFMLPEEVKGEGWWPSFYNRTLGSDFYKENVRPYVDKCLGGTLRLFANKVYTGNYFSNKHEVELSINASLPNGCTLEQMNALVMQMEAYLSQFSEIKQFQTQVHNAQRASIAVQFTKESERTGFPYILKANVISKALELGGGSWNVYGLEDQGFSNDVRETAGSYRVEMMGYNYDDLMEWAEQVRDSLLTYRRIKQVDIRSDFSMWKDDYSEYYLQVNKKRMIEEGITASQLFDALIPVFGGEISCGTVWMDEKAEQVRLVPKQAREYDVWALQYMPIEVNGRIYKVSDLTTLTRGQAPQKIKKQNQAYVLCLQYDYIGSSMQGDKVLKKEVEKWKERLPMGYEIAVKNPYGFYWEDDEVVKEEYLLLFLVIGIIFMTTSVLFNSVKQPLAIIFVIPISYIGVFLTFYLFDLDFDQGGFAAFVLLCGITVNASIYILNEFNNIRRCFPNMPLLTVYMKAWNAKVIPIFLTVVSTILGFVLFMIGSEKEAFWFPLAAGTIGGLVMSLVGILVYLPVFSLSRKEVLA